MSLKAIGVLVFVAIALAGAYFLTVASQTFAMDPAAGLFDIALAMICLSPAAYLALRFHGVIATGSAAALLALVATVMQSASMVH